ncbi:hypothetical protein QYE76_024072 [Lolium multiflorum]|uniref:RNase H type-1 domain-containing protein n=1 Tax=Lolium multiflorum TaxID=4521 RepID=A0AAD8RBR5_LOLMU|nr:hypothetical protein QYE76_024072 [Lolium multiflorum]
MGTRERDDNQMRLFRECLDDCGLMDMGYTGPKFTWSNRQEDTRNVRVRLDRAVANGDFLGMFDDCSVENIQKEASGELKGICNGKNGPPISHLLFADDSVFFARGDDRSIDALKTALETYCDGSGQKINRQKSSVFFGNHCAEHVKERVKQKIGVQDDTLQATYLDWISEATGFHSMALAVAIWHIWDNRNNVRNGETLPHPSRVVAIFAQSRSAGFGVVIRDHQGNVRAANHGGINCDLNPEVAEALALRQALTVAKFAGFQNVVVASDCLSLINKVKAVQLDRSPTGEAVVDGGGGHRAMEARLDITADTKYIRCSHSLLALLSITAVRATAVGSSESSTSAASACRPSKVRKKLGFGMELIATSDLGEVAEVSNGLDSEPVADAGRRNALEDGAGGEDPHQGVAGGEEKIRSRRKHGGAEAEEATWQGHRNGKGCEVVMAAEASSGASPSSLFQSFFFDIPGMPLTLGSETLAIPPPHYGKDAVDRRPRTVGATLSTVGTGCANSHRRHSPVGIVPAGTAPGTAGTALHHRHTLHRRLGRCPSAVPPSARGAARPPRRDGAGEGR